MTLSNAFRLSFYLSLAMSCVCLFYGEWEFLPWMTGLLPVVLTLMAVAFLREGREYLSEQAANRLGTFIGLGTILWIGYKVPRNDQDVIAGGVPWPAALVPLLAPLLPVLLLVKLFRPKRAKDFWVFQTIGLVIVTLSCILAGEMFFFVLLTLYLVTQLWCMGLFLLYRNLILKPAGHESLFGKSQLLDQTRVAGQSLIARRVTGWSTLVMVAGLGIFLLLPRFSESPWVPAKLSSTGRTSFKTGIDPAMGMDLYREGPVRLSPEPAFEVEVRDASGAAAGLPLNQHWRVQILDDYDRGHFKNWLKSGTAPPGVTKSLAPVPGEEHFRAPAVGASAAGLMGSPLGHEPFLAASTFVAGSPHFRFPSSFPESVPAGMEQGQLFLVLHLTPMQTGHGMPLADPVDHLTHVGLYPQVAGAAASRPILNLNTECDVYLTTSMLAKNVDRLWKVGQLLIPKYQDKEFPVVKAGDKYIPGDTYVRHLMEQEVPGPIAEWTHALVRKLPELEPADYATNSFGRTDESMHAKLARALSHHLAESGEFTYSLRGPKLGISMDPTAEFLLKVKEGHCERYAAGLTLMLRSMGIPARIVKGYNGCEMLDKGRYLIRQDHAHSWVEALVPGKEPGSKIWLQLDPTPSASAEAGSLTFIKWVWTRITNPDFAWKSLVMDYNSDRQGEVGDQFKLLWNSVSSATSNQSARENLWNMVRVPALSLLSVVSILIAYSIWRRQTGRRRRSTEAGRSPPTQPLTFYSRLLKVLASQCQLRPSMGQTPLEFAGTAQDALAARLTDAGLIALPRRVVQELYQQRFSGHAATPEISQALEADVSHLDGALRNSVR